MALWPYTTIPKSTGNAFDLSVARPSGFATAHEMTKAKKHETAHSFDNAGGISQRGLESITVPAKRVGISIGKAPKGRVPVIPNAHRSSK